MALNKVPPVAMRALSSNLRGFSLLELLAVIAVMLVLVSLSVASMPGILSTYRRKTADDVLLATIEQARIAAIRNGENVYVVMALARDSGISPDALIVVGDQPLGSTASGVVLYTHWIRLPTNIRFHVDTYKLTLASNATTVNTSQLPPINGGPSYAGFTFNSTGAISNPVTGPGPNGSFLVALYEGTRSAHGGETALGASAKATQGLSDSGLYDIVRLNQYTGRSWLDISNLLH